MSRTIVAPLVKEIESFVMKYGINRGETLSALLDFIIGYLDPEGHPVEGWKYNIEQNACFYNMMSTYFNVMQEGLKHNGWYDAFGDIFMEWAGSKNALGQCFTPACICDMMADMKHYSGYSFENLEELLTLLQTINGKFILSNYMCPMLASFISKNGWMHKEIELPLKVANFTKARHKAEVLIWNFEQRREKSLFDFSTY